ncbi:MAG: transporter substrate-binding domain-containing protein [Acidobacteria bacterium]|nr:transporter substrate-binding domain-containing protein [Acidobacteriota bacterium]MCG3192674.1 Membrane-bound lytic murein transglycosylase F [Thermoanaerobaculia bacterium]
MKRLLLSVCLLVAATAALGQGQPASKPRESAKTGVDGTHAVAGLQEAFTGDLDAMLKRRMIRVLTPYSKTGYFVDKGVTRGLIYDLFRLFETDLNKKLKSKNLKVNVYLIPTPAGKLAQHLQEGKGDIVATTALITEERLRQMDFTVPVRRNVSEVIVTGPGGPEIASLEELSGKTIFLSRAWAFWKDMEDLNARFVKEGKAPLKILEAPATFSTEDILEMVNAGIVPATAAHDYIAEFWKKVFPKLKVNKGAVVKAGGEIAAAIRKGSPLLKAELDAFIVKYPEGSKQREQLLASYLKNTRFAKEATSAENRIKLENLANLYKKYGEKYGIDFLLMAAQGYQESGLNQDAKSPVGAVGVMQLMPGTGQDMKVGDISELEPNIHAGVKYMRFMIDKFYGDEPNMSQLDKGLFTFASYNAGPARIAQMRKIAEQRGLDPNVWFNNVEVIVAERVGREPVTYVSNIYKYYIGYKLIMEQLQAQQSDREGMKKDAGKP